MLHQSPSERHVHQLSERYVRDAVLIELNNQHQTQADNWGDVAGARRRGPAGGARRGEAAVSARLGGLVAGERGRSVGAASAI